MSDEEQPGPTHTPYGQSDPYGQPSHLRPAADGSAVALRPADLRARSRLATGVPAP